MDNIQKNTDAEQKGIYSTLVQIDVKLFKNQNISKSGFCHIFSTFPTFKDLDHQKMTHFPLYSYLFLAIKGSKVVENPKFIKISIFLLNKSFGKPQNSQKLAADAVYGC